MRIFSYVITHDTGFSPNPFWGYCTLADCKPKIRRTAEVGDWIVGLSPKADGNRVIYAMQVDEILQHKGYYRDKRFAAKIPDFRKGKIVHKCGDNIYRPLPNGGFRQLQSMHSHNRGPEENPKTKDHDLGGINVLISKTFHYFGSQARELPSDLNALKVGRAHKCRFSQESVSRFLRFIAAQPAGISGPPTQWPSSDESWRQ